MPYISGTGYEANNKTDFTYNTDVTPPTIAITGPSGTVSGPTTITFTLSEASSDFALSAGDITVTGGGTLSNFAQNPSNPLVYTATYTPPATSTGAATINVASGVFHDAANNANADGGDVNNHLPLSYDTVTPTVVVTRATSNVLGGTGAPYTTELVTFTLSEASTDFTSSSVTTSGGALSNWTAVSSTVYTATFTPTSGAAGTGTIGVQAGKFHDAAGNANADTYLPGQGANSQAAGTADANQVEVDYDTQAPTQTVSFSSMTKDSGLSTGNANWTTADASAGRLVSGFLSAPLNFGETVEIWTKTSSGAAVLVGTATVNAAGTAWEFTDTTNYVGATGATGNTAGWTYTAKVVDAAGNAGTPTDQVVNGDYTEAAPVITAVTDSASTSIAPNGTTANTLGSVSGTGVAGDTIYLYDNTGTNLVGTTVVQAGGTWTISGLATNAAIGNGSNTFAAKQVDPLGNESVLSNLWTVSTSGPNQITNGDFEDGNTGFTGVSALTGNPIVSSNQGYNTMTLADANSGIPTADITTNATSGGNYSFGTWTTEYIRGANDAAAIGNPDGAMSGLVMVGQITSAASNPFTTIWANNVTVVAGKTYTFYMDYINRDFQGVDMGLTIDGQYIQFVPENSTFESGHLTVTYTATTSKTFEVKLTAQNNNTATYGDFVLDNISFSPATPQADGTLTAGGTPPATPNPDSLTYTAGSLDALASDDTITASSTSLQSILAAGGFIDGGAGIDTLKLAAGTTLNLESLTANQTVQKIQEVEIFKLQGSSTLQMSANDVLSLGGANASTMAPFTFNATQQVNDGNTAPTGTTSSEGKVQMVVQGTNSDTLKLDTLASDGITSATGVAGNAGLSGVWSYMGTVQIGMVTYKVYDHSTTNAQVLVDVPVIVNTISPITIAAISDDSISGSNLLTAIDFVTKDNTLTYSGTVPVEFVDASHDVYVEILNSSGQVVRSGTASISGTSWTWDDTGYTLADGNYTIRSTIVDQGTQTATTSFGANGVDTQPLVIDTQLPTIVVTRATSNTLGAGQTEAITFTLSEASTDFTAADVTVTGGSIINFSGSGTTYTATYVPDGSATGTVKVDSAKFSDQAGNLNADGADTAVGTTNIVSIAYQAAPTQTVTFSSMTKDSGLPTSSTNNHDWLTADGSAGRLVSGTIDAPLTGSQVVKVYANGVEIGTATTVGQAWEITDINGYNANWVYTAKVVDTAGNAGPVTTQNVNTDFTEAAPVIISVTDSGNSSVANNGSTTNTLSTVSGTGAAGDTIYLYDNTGTNLVGTTTVASNGTWSISGLASNAGVGAGSNTFSARQVDALGNSSVLSNLWTVNAGGPNMAVNGDFSGGNTGFTATPTYHAAGATNFTGTYWTDGTRYSVDNKYEGYDANLATTLAAGGTAGTGASAITWATDYGSTTVTATLPNPDGAFTGNMLIGNIGSSTVSANTEMMVWSETLNLVAGKTYVFKFDYWNDYARLNASIGGQKFQFTTVDNTSTSEAGHFTATFLAQTTGPVDFKLYATAYSYTGANGNFAFDNIFVSEAPPQVDNSLTANGTLPFTTGVDGTVTAITYTGGAVDMLSGNDVLNIGTNVQTLLSTAGNVIDGSAGVDTLKLAAGTTLDLTALTHNQTVKPIQEVEVFQMQGSSSLTLSANDVLSLGGSNASTMSAYTFSGTTGGAGSASSTGKVQMVITGTTSDALNLNALATDGVTSNGIQGNTGLSGEWQYMGTTTSPINGVTYKVYNHSTTNAQVLTDLTASTESAVVAFSSMTKDSSLSTAQADWLTADGSAGRLVSGTLADPIGTNTLKVYANGVQVNSSMVSISADGKSWAFTDVNGYNANWTYRADVVNSSNVVIGSATQVVTTDFTEAAPVITGVTDSGNGSVANNGSTPYSLSSVSGTGNAGDTIYLYDNSGTNLVGTTVVGSNGQWVVSGLATVDGITAGSSTFSAKQVDALGNVSVLSNLWTVDSGGNNLTPNGDFNNTANFTSSLSYVSNATFAGYGYSGSNGYTIYTDPLAAGIFGAGATTGTAQALTTSATTTTTTAAGSTMAWSVDSHTVGRTATGTTLNNFQATRLSVLGSDSLLAGTTGLGGVQTLYQTPANQILVEAGHTYNFSFNYFSETWGTLSPTAIIDGVSMTVVDPRTIGASNTETHMTTGTLNAVYTAQETKYIDIKIIANNSGASPYYAGGDYWIDDVNFSEKFAYTTNALSATGTPPFTAGVDGASTAITYTGGVADMLSGNDVLNIGTNAQTLLSTAGNLINGSTGVDTLKLATGTVLDLTTLTSNQTVKPIAQVEVVQMQGTSTLTLNTNDVLSLGGANATTMAPYTFTSMATTANGGTVSTDKVQFVVQGGSTDTLVLNDLKLDGVTTNGIVGNTGLAGQWDYKGTVTLTGVDGLSHTYKVYDQSTTQAQVLVDSTMNVLVDNSTTITTTAAFSSMTKDSSASTANADWTTNDASAGRLVSGSLSAALGANEVVKVYANGALVGTANVVGQAWEITDTNGYTGNWAYTAQVVNTSTGAGGVVTTQVVTTDLTEAAPVITVVTDSTAASVANAGSTANTLSTVSGIGNAGNTIYLYDNSGTNLVGTTTVGSDGTWSISVANATGVGYGSNTFSARQTDALGNGSVLSNLWTVTTTAGNVYTNPTMDAGSTGITSDLTYGSNANWAGGTNNYAVYAIVPTTTAATTLSSTNNAYTGGTWSKTYVAAFRNPDGAMVGKTLAANVYTAGTSTVWGTSMDVVEGRTYTFKFDYAFGDYASTNSTAMDVVIDGQTIHLVTTGNESGHFTATYTATSTKSVDLAINGVRATAGTGGGDFDLDNFVFAESPPATVTLTAGGTGPFSSAADGVSTAITYTAGVADMLAGDDTLNIGTNAQTLLATAGNVVSGGAGVDTLKLATGTTLDLTALTHNQTVTSVEQFEIVKMQGSSSLTLSANDVLSLGGSNASTMSAYTFSGTTGGAGSASSNGKVQMVITGTTSDALSLNALAVDGVTTNGVVGNTGLVGEWQYMGTTTSTVNGVTYKVYNHSTTNAQVLTDLTASTESAVVAFSSMTKDSSLSTAQADWLTADGSAGRLVSGTLADPIGTNTLKVYANGVQVNSSLVSISADGKSWAFTDVNGYNANWTYRADVVNSSNVVIGSATQVVTTDFTEAAPVITSVTDSTDASIANAGSTGYTLSTVSGTGNAGDTIYLYDNTGTNLVGTTTVAADGTWSISGLATNTAVGSGSNTFSARQMDALGNESVLSNLWTVSALGGGNTVVNGDFSSGNGGFTTTNVAYTTAMNHYSTANQYALTTNVPTVSTALLTHRALTTTANANLSWKTDYNATGDYNNVYLNNPNLYSGNPNGKMSGTVLEVNLGTGGTFWQETMNVVAGKTYTFEFDYKMNSFGTTAPRLTFDGTAINFTTNGYETGHFTATYTATTTGTITASLYADNSATGANNGDFTLDNVSFTPNTVAADGSLTAAGTAPFTSNIDGTSTAITYTGGAADMLSGNDVLNIGTNAQTLLGTAGNFINGSTGVDTLKLAAGTTLDLTALTNNQTVKSIEQVEVVQMQGNSLLALSANDVLSLGGSNATTMAPYSFSSMATTANGGTTSTNKVQFVVQGGSTDTLVLDGLKLDGVTTNGTVGNTGLSGQWDYKGTVTLMGVDGLSHTYKVYDQSTTAAQVLVDSAMNVLVDNSSTITAVASFTSMTKDSSTSTANADWTTNDASAGRLVSGTLSTALGANEVIKVYANGALIGTASVAGQAWAFTDTNGYTGNWVYTAQVVNTSTSEGGAVTTQMVSLDNTEAAPVITSVIDSADVSLLNGGSTYYGVSTVNGTGVAGDTVYLYDNTNGNLVATTTVGSDGTWSVSGVASNLATGSGSNAFYAKQMDALGNVSALSNSWTVTSTGSGNQLENGDLSLGTAGATGSMTYSPGVTHNQLYSANGFSYTLFSTTPTQTNIALSATQNYGTTAGNTTQMTYQINYSGQSDQSNNPGGLFSGEYFGFNAQSAAYGTFWSDTVNVVAGQTYNFSLDYINWNQNVRLYIGDAYVGLWGSTATAGSGNTGSGSILYAHGWGTYTATTTGTLSMELRNIHGMVDFQFDNLYFGQAATPANGTLAAGSTAPFTPSPDGTSTAITYTGGTADMLAGDDVLNIGTNAQTLLGTAGNVINGSTGIDTLKLAANTALNLVSLTNNQTVKSIQQVEVFELQGGSTLTLSANDVLSLGMANAFTSNGKVQFMVNGTASDTVSLQNLLSDGAGGNTGLTGMWASAGTATYGVNTYNLYNHDTTGAQVWVKSTLTSVSLSVSPLMLDLNGDGVQTTSLADGVLFDLLANGTPQQTAWVDRHDGLLALDLNGDGTINSGAELLGSSSRLADGSLARDGWQALAQYDANDDGQIDLSDAVFNQLRVWVDADADGTTDAGELRTLADVGVQSIALAHTATQIAQNGNILDGMATVQHTDGSTTQMTDAWLSVQQQPVLNLDAVAHANGVVDLSNGQAQVLQINAGDVLQLPTNASGQHVLQVQGDSNDTVNLSKVFADGHAQGEWTTSGTTTQNGHTYNVYQHSGDASLQVLIDQHIVQSNVHLS